MAVVGFLSPVAVILFGPFCGRMMDFTPRRRALRFITCTQTGAIVLAGTAHAPVSMDCSIASSARVHRQALTLQ